MSEKFLQAKLEHQAAISKALSTQRQSVEENDENEQDVEDLSLALGKLVKSYDNSQASAESDANAQIGQQIADFLLSGTAACLVCIEEVKKKEAIWSCSNCYGIFHLGCIQRWIREGVYQRISNDFNSPNPPPDSVPWNCPKCRFEYSPKVAPTAYFCYCGKCRDPEQDPWLLPHSCGQVCGRTFKPACTHACLMLCHPGPCPPCPAFVQTTCFCGKSQPSPRRCNNREWSCTKRCSKRLDCQRHECSLICHSGPCEKCHQTVLRPCRCGRKKEKRVCSDEDWSCGEVCGRSLPCGRHSCQEKCHGGAQCPPCPLTLPRRCPCGKTAISGLSCDIEMTPSCFETCEKLLACGEHKCYQMCHTGDCGQCRESVARRCRCGARQKTVLCFQGSEVTCETRCQKMRDCGRHQCKRKCCLPGSCPPCENQCNRPLACGKHKCQSRCHNGRCYPCSEIIKLSCDCGKTTLRVPCGTKNVKPPKCLLLCQKPSRCRHEAKPHKCHFRDCPPCTEDCGAPTASKCGHFCESKCHDWVWVQIKDESKEAELRQQPQGPWMMRETTARWERKALPCPPCQHLVDVTCLGGHEVVKMPCSLAKRESCHRKCGKLLDCGQHVCETPCHASTTRCDECVASCEQPRPEGCQHPCSQGICHQGKCKPCKRVVTKRCYCDQMLLGIECYKLTVEESALVASKCLSCGNRCARNMSCGHQCLATCHSGDCPQSEACAEAVVRRCACKRIRQSEPCNGKLLQGAELQPLPCDDACRARAKAALEKAAKLKEPEHAEDNGAGDLVVAEPAVRQRRKRHRNRDDDAEDVKTSVFEKLAAICSIKQLIISTVAVTLISAVVFILINY